MKTLIAALALVLFSGCAGNAYWVEKRYKPEKGGVVAFKSNGMMSGSREDDAKEKMAEFCAPHAYELLSEHEKDIETGSSANYDAFTNRVYVTKHSSEHRALDFRCLGQRGTASQQ